MLLNISTRNAAKLSGQILILVALGMQSYVLAGESKLRNLRAEHEAKVDHHQHFIDLVTERNIDNIIIQKAVEIHQRRADRQEIDWKRDSKIRRDKISSLGSTSFYASIIFILGTLLFSIGEYLSYRKEHKSQG